MIRNLKALVAAALALAAIGAVSAPGAQAAEFHCSVEPCKVTMKSDGTGKTSHHVLVIKKGATSAALTCESISGEAESAKKTTTQLAFKNIVYTGCNLAGTPGATVEMNGCDFEYTPILSFDISCNFPPFSFKIKITLCQISIGSQEGLKSVSYTNINSKKEITTSMAVKNIKASVEGCAAFGLANGEYNESEYSTGNTIMFAEGGASLWFE